VPDNFIEELTTSSPSFISQTQPLNLTCSMCGTSNKDVVFITQETIVNVKLCSNCIPFKDVYNSEDSINQEEQARRIDEAEKKLAICCMNYHQRMQITPTKRSIVYVFSSSDESVTVRLYSGFSSRGELRIEEHLMMIAVFRKYNLKCDQGYYSKYQYLAELVNNGKELFYKVLTDRQLIPQALFKETLFIKTETIGINFNVNKNSNILSKDDLRINDGV